MRHALVTAAAAALVAALVVVGAGHPSTRADASSRSTASVRNATLTKSDTTSRTTATSTTTATTSTTTTATSVSSLGDENFPDPFVLTTSDGYVAFSTNSGNSNVPEETSTDLTHWTSEGDALPNLPDWALESGTWAPSVIEIDGSYVMYVTLFDTRSDNECVFTAIASTATGPYSLTSSDPLVCAANGSIDASVMRTSDGQLWLTWKDEAHDGQPATIEGASLRFDGLALSSSGTALVSATESWEHDNVEAPSMIRSGDQYVLFFSTGAWTTSGYSTGYAVCSTPVGPCTVHDGAWLSSADGLDGPGGLQVFTGTNGTLYVAFHTWQACKDCSEWKRVLNIRTLELDGTTPKLT